MKTEHQVQQYLYEHIPLSKAMEVRVSSASAQRVLLAAPLGPNINHRETVFGGSASAVAILSAWTLIHLRLIESGVHGRLVIQRNAMNYEAPIEDAFTAECTFNDTGAWDRFMHTLDRRNRARITAHSILECGGKKVAAFKGDFVAIVTPPKK